MSCLEFEFLGGSFQHHFFFNELTNMMIVMAVMASNLSITSIHRVSLGQKAKVGSEEVPGNLRPNSGNSRLVKYVYIIIRPYSSLSA